MNSAKCLLLAPHNDDEVLFASYTLLRFKPTVVICTYGHGQEGVTGQQRANESRHACEVLGVEDVRQWTYPDNDVPWGQMAESIELVIDSEPWETVFAPMNEESGHEQHNEIGQLAFAANVSRAERRSGQKFQPYMTYRRGYGRTHTENEVPFMPSWPALKLKAMACYWSQIGIENTRPWFFADDAYREWWA